MVTRHWFRLWLEESEPMLCEVYVTMMTSSNGNIWCVTGHLCGVYTGLRWIPHTKASDAELWCFFICAWINDQRLCWWFESPSRSLWRHCNDVIIPYISVPFQMSEARTSCHEDEEAGSALHLSHHPRRAGPWRGKQSLCWQPGKPSQNPRGLHDTLLLQTEWQSGLWSSVRQHERRHPNQ